MSTVSLNDISMGYDDRGAGPALVLVHGHPFDRSMWRPQLERFSRSGWRVIAPDLRGYGETTVIAGKTPLETFARDIAALLDHRGIDRAVLTGLSMGGQIVMEFQRLFPRRVAGLVLADTSAQAETEEGKRLRNEAADRLLCEGMQRYAEEVLPRMVAPYNLRIMPDVAAHVLGMMRRTSAEGAAAALRGRAERPDYRDVLSRATVPALIVVGRDDDFTPLSDAELMHHHLEDARVIVIDGAAHMPNLERPDDFNHALAEFLSVVPEPA
jgi:pimeloyl-ACP methyl ester carboxylesterase